MSLDLSVDQFVLPWVALQLDASSIDELLVWVQHDPAPATRRVEKVVVELPDLSGQEGRNRDPGHQGVATLLV